VVEDSEEVIVTRSGHEAAVIISLSEWNSIKETQYLLSNPVNAARLRKAISDLEAGKGVEHELIED
jgi:antitoxin YefM